MAARPPFQRFKSVFSMARATVMCKLSGARCTMRQLPKSIWPSPSPQPPSAVCQVWGMPARPSRFFGAKRENLDKVREWASEKDLEEARLWSSKFEPENLPIDRMKASFVRSSGAGGQNVNKLNTKAEVRFSMSDARNWMPRYTIKRIEALEASRINKKGEFAISSQRHRTQEQNLNDCYKKIWDIIKEASKTPTDSSEEQKLRIKNLQRKANEERLKRKTKHSEKKTLRRERKDSKFFL